MSDELEHLRTQLRIRQSPQVWARLCAKIEDKEKQLVAFVPNLFQRRMSDAYEWQREQGIACRQIDLKPRQVGGTTMGAAITYHHCRNFPCNAVMIADTHPKSQKLLKMYERFAKNDAFDWGAEDVFTNQWQQLGHSLIERMSAEAPRGTRGGTLMAVHASEVAFWPSTPAKSADETNAALRNALASHAQTLDIEESTPKGATGIFHTIWEDARWPEYDPYWKKYGVEQPEGEGNGYLRVFAAWYEFPEHATALSCEQEGLDIEATLTSRERRGIKLYEWTLEQIKWRRRTLKEKCLNDERRLDEEYPEDPTSCFLSSGSPRFDTEGMAYLELITKSASVQYGNLTANEEYTLNEPLPPSLKVNFRQERGENSSTVRLWEPPRVGCEYLISIDPNSGAEADGSKQRDSTSVLVWRASYLSGNRERVRTRLVARLRPPWQVENTPTAKYVALLARWYGDCIVIVERNVGIGLIDALKRYEVDLYAEEQLDLVTSKTTRKVGWMTTAENRDVPIDALGDLIRDQQVDIRCPHVVGELRTFVRTKTGKYEAASGRHDDDVMSAGIGVCNIRLATRLTEKPRLRQPPEEGDYKRPMR